MSTPSTPSSSSALTMRRMWMSQAFAWFALGATLFGLIILAIFCLALAADVVRWFIHMPGQVVIRNAEVVETVRQSKEALLVLEERQRQREKKRGEIAQELAEELRQAPQDKRASIQKKYDEKVLPTALANLEQTIQETLIREQPLLSASFSDLDKEMAGELALAPPEKHAEIREFYLVTLRPHKFRNLEKTIPERIRTAANIRTNTSALAALWHFLSAGPNGEPDQAGVRPALFGSLTVVLIAILTALPVGIGAALYLEEYSARNWLAQIIQVNINNLAGVPSVMYGILGAFVFVELIFRPLEGEFIKARNALGGGLTLALLTLPLIIVAAQEAIRAVPPSLRHGAHALGATKWQVTWRVVLPPATPGLLTGVILAVSRAIGEAAPLLLFGALLIVDQNPGLFDRFSVLPMQIFDWSEQPDELWRYNAALASALLVVTLLALNGTAIVLRQRFVKGLKY